MGGPKAVGDLLSMRELEKLGLVEAKTFGAAFDRFAANPSDRPTDWNTLWGAITAEAYARWFRRFKDGDPQPQALPFSTTVPM